MNKCEKCYKQFSWFTVYRSIWGWTYKPIKCDKCGSKHRITFIGRLTNTFLTIVPMIIYMNLLSPFENIFLWIGTGLLIAFFGSLLTPYLVAFAADSENSSRELH